MDGDEEWMLNLVKAGRNLQSVDSLDKISYRKLYFPKITRKQQNISKTLYSWIIHRQKLYAAVFIYLNTNSEYNYHHTPKI